MAPTFLVQDPAARAASRKSIVKDLIRQRPPPSLLQGRPKDRTQHPSDPNRHTSPHSLLATAPSHGRAPIFSASQVPSLILYVFCFIVFMALLLSPLLYNEYTNYTRRRRRRRQYRAKVDLSGGKEEENMLPSVDIEMDPLEDEEEYSGDDELEITDDEWATRHRQDCLLPPPNFYGDVEGTIIGNFLK